MEILQTVHPLTNEPTGILLPRHEVIARGEWCRSTNVFILHPDGRILCHKRSMQKERLPGVWSTHLGGHVGHDETYESNAIKEIHEEAGIVVSPEELLSWRTTPLEKGHLWVREFVTVTDMEAEEFIPQPGEVDEFRWMHAHEVIDAHKENPNMWCAGTHDFRVEYACMRAVCTAAKTIGVFTNYTLSEAYSR